MPHVWNCFSVGGVIFFALSVFAGGSALGHEGHAKNAGEEASCAGEAAGEEGFEPIFNGEDLQGWEGKDQFWSVENGAITGQTTRKNPARGNTFLIWREGKVGDFELKIQYRIRNHNSGIQYRSKEMDNFVVGGYQADIEGGDTWSGANYEERGRGILAKRGQKVIIKEGGGRESEQIADPAELQAQIHKWPQWNEYHIIARGNHLIHKINGHVMSEVIDNSDQGARSGILALQLHAGPPMKVQFKDIMLKRTGEQTSAADANEEGDKRHVLFLAGKKSHGYGAHEHMAGCKLLADVLEKNMPNITTRVVSGYPEETEAFRGVDAVVVYCDGGGRHLLNDHLEEFDKVMQSGVGLVCLHYGVEVPKGAPGEHFLKWIGGYFETNWSVNPHWEADFEGLPDHPVARGVEPFEILDEWYYHMRFREGKAGVTPILSDLPPESSLSRPDGPHSGNPAVRAAVLEREEPQHVAWAAERPASEGGGRGFGFTGGHFHWNWGHDDMRTLVLNAIAWAAHAEVPQGGVPSETPTVEELMANQDYDVPPNFDREEIRHKLREWNDPPKLTEEPDPVGR